jgi:hypothetical protein
MRNGKQFHCTFHPLIANHSRQGGVAMGACNLQLIQQPNSQLTAPHLLQLYGWNSNLKTARLASELQPLMNGPFTMNYGNGL